MLKTLETSKESSIYLLCGIFIFALIIRIYHFDEIIPVTMDALDSFSYASDISTIGRLPENYDIAKPGWSIFLGGVFSLFNFEDTLSYMQIQKISAILISSLSVFPLYFLIRRFSEKKYSLLGVLFFGLEPRLIENSILGNAEPIFIICIITAMLFLLNSNKKIIYLSFLMAGISTCFRPEGLFLFFGITVMFFVKFRKDKLNFPKYLIGLIIFLLVITPIGLHQMEVGMYEPVILKPYIAINSLLESGDNISENIETQEVLRQNSIGIGIETFSKYFVWVLIPMFIILVPPGFILFLKNMNIEKVTIIVVGIFLSIPAFYAYTFPLLETKYLYYLIPIFCILSTFSLEYFIKKISKKKIIFSILLIAIIFSSFFFVDFQLDLKHDKESSMIAQFIVMNTNAVNDYYPESTYIWGYDVPEKWKDYKKFYEKMNRTEWDIQAKERGLEQIPKIELHNPRTVWVQDPNKFDTLELFLLNPEKDKISHLVVDGKSDRVEFLNDVFMNEERYAFLEKIYDSKDESFDYHVKIFEINYEKFGEN